MPRAHDSSPPDANKKEPALTGCQLSSDFLPVSFEVAGCLRWLLAACHLPRAPTLALSRILSRQLRTRSRTKETPLNLWPGTTYKPTQRVDNDGGDDDDIIARHIGGPGAGDLFCVRPACFIAGLLCLDEAQSAVTSRYFDSGVKARNKSKQAECDR